MTIDGYSQPGTSQNTDPPGQADNARILIQLSGALAPANSSGLTINAEGCGVRGLVINRFSTMRSTLVQNVFDANDNVIQGNFIGTNAAGTAALPNGASNAFGNGGIVLLSGHG